MLLAPCGQLPSGAFYLKGTTMNKALIVLNLIVIVSCSFILTRIEQVRTPELFGDATMLTFRPFGIGLIVNRSYVFAFNEIKSESMATGRIVQVLGNKIDGADSFVPYLLHYNKSNTKFTGWIYFRGHERAFCGYNGDRDFPFPCRWNP